ncbi:sugar ABC transporter permease [Paenibacillus sp. TRM 82003]|uniref:carbohydrate ABC transporter permease n=1 Tax=Kineococcus sp. TRM81007 TaxID=2925831 RepID=UPI001F55E24C|nr:sugar ABC transporter permease [Kineococcus sp. TRM81007]MCI2237140.1 sugar ABC transporter permease [Kineococcus sp. TRM81007]MCI3925261.1 sugar ABC transporter permease [Paenibacillus sp. TRM 82003]
MSAVADRATATRPARGRRAAAGSSSRGNSLTHPTRTGLLLVLPALAFVVVFVLVPLVFAVYMSMTNWPLIGSYEFTGLRNYVGVAQDPVFWKSVGYTLLYTAIVTLPILVVGYALAVVVRSNRRGSTFFRTVFFLPYVIGLTTLSFLVVLEAQPSSGAVNIVLERLGITDGTTAWLADGPLATGLICVMIIWAVSGLTMVLLMGGMQGIPREVYESAEMDGASWWQRERSITAPMLRRTIAMSLVISVIGSLLAFTQFYVLTRGGPGTDTQTVVMYIYQRGFVQLQLGAASALSIVLVLVIGLVTAAQFRLLREKE